MADGEKLPFDLTEGARAARATKRATILTWQDFSSGFSRTDAPLNATLQFSTPVTNTVNSWPAHSGVSGDSQHCQRRPGTSAAM
ncbi:uncharacterized protein B0H18DRAFT_1116292 [Fomitopsis serialis]|uniref:uncharacterized protein n=1 Tax=Fomitopsis serialis TaxID=139415 RepID=UPI0020089174|nr:uncharacterized protein B0H18DRAFT_1116292 [Neoantrodia serialis]KAH9931491.1 hypothetical protein B0H18DRAFT_1116292 [Neoantrodia serialis]